MHRQTQIPPAQGLSQARIRCLFSRIMLEMSQGANIDRHCDKSETLVADAAVPLVRLPACIRAHVPPPCSAVHEEGKTAWVCHSTCYPDVRLPVVLVESVGRPRREGGGWRRWWRRLRCCFAGWQGASLWANVWCPSRRKMARGKKNPESSHYPADLGRNTDCKVTTAGTKKLYFYPLPLSQLTFSDSEICTSVSKSWVWPSSSVCLSGAGL